MAHKGPGAFSIVPVQKVPEDVRGTIPETKWINLLGMVLNRQLPFNGLDRLYRGHLIARDEGHHRSTTWSWTSLTGAATVWVWMRP